MLGREVSGEMKAPALALGPGIEIIRAMTTFQLIIVIHYLPYEFQGYRRLLNASTRPSVCIWTSDQAAHRAMRRPADRRDLAWGRFLEVLCILDQRRRNESVVGSNGAQMQARACYVATRHALLERADVGRTDEPVLFGLLHPSCG